jgi:NAD(P)-dependent dehydrogenase (short-subunit alcohol dehydrogenase family)
MGVLFAREGAKVCISHRREGDGNAKATKDLIEKEGSECLLMPGDLTQDGKCEEVVNAVISRFGKLDILVNNAAIFLLREKFSEFSVADLQRVLSVNCVVPFALCRAALPHLEAQECSCIINMSSVTAFKGMAEAPEYAASKAAVLGLTRSLALSGAKSRGQHVVRVNSIAPGPIESPLTKSIPRDKLEAVGKATPCGRMGQAEEVATCAVFLASQDSSYITGQTLHPNGGEIINA